MLISGHSSLCLQKQKEEEADNIRYNNINITLNVLTAQ